MNLPLLVAMMSIAISSAEAQTDEIPEIVQRHSPIYVSRSDQIRNRETDRILAVGYSLLPTAEGGIKIRYTTYFSDEDSVSGVAGEERQMARYGRRLDIEWSYEVVLAPHSAEVRSRTYQCDSIAGIGHARCRFRGKFRDGTDRPILYNNARHNIFGDRPRFPYGSARGFITDHIPDFEIAYPKSRDLLVLENPELLRASDEELEREHKLGRPSTSYLYLRIRGTIEGGLLLGIEDAEGTKFQTSLDAKNEIIELGSDLWGRESLVAIPVPDEVLTDLHLGTNAYRFLTVGRTAQSKIILEEVGAYVVEKTDSGSYATIDLSGRVTCENSSDLNSCWIR